MKKMKTLGIGLLIGLSVLSMGCSNKKPENTYQEPETLTEQTGGITDEPERAPEISAKDIDGKDVKLSSFKGQYVWVHFWSTTCTYCVSEMPDFVTFAKQHEKELKIITVNTGDDLETIKDFMTQYQMNLTTVQDTGNALSDAYYVEGYPSTYFIDPQGKIIGFVPQQMKLSEMETALTYLKEHATK